jgi:hypothetical protein
LEKHNPTSAVGCAKTIVMNLTDGLWGYHRTVAADNFFTTISLAKSLLRNDTYLLGILRSNEVYGFQSNNSIKLIKWKDKRDILMIFTKKIMIQAV